MTSANNDDADEGVNTPHEVTKLSTKDDDDNHHQQYPQPQNGNKESSTETRQEQLHHEEFPPASKLACPVDMSCLWTGPTWAVKTWVSSAAGFLGLNPNHDADITTLQRGHRAGRRRSGGRSSPRYIALTSSSSTDSNASAGADDDDDDDDDDDTGSNVAVQDDTEENNTDYKAENSSNGSKKQSSNDINGKNNNNNNNNKNTVNTKIGLINPTLPTSSLFRSGFAQAMLVGSPQNPIAVSAEFEVWQKYIRDLSNFSALDIDVAVIASTTDRASPCPYLHLTIRGPIIPCVGRCRRTLNDTSFIAPRTDEEWQEANPIAVMDVVEAFLLSVVAPQAVADDDAIENIIETGTRILAHPALELSDFLRDVAQFVRQKCHGVKLVIRDIDFTAEFESARQQIAERFLVLDVTTTTSSASHHTSTVVAAREPRTSSAASIMGNVFTSPLGVARTAFTGQVDHGSCPVGAINAFDADYTMLDIVRAARNVIRRVIQNVPNLKSIEVRGCLMRDTDLDVNGILAGRTSVHSVVESNNQSSDDDIQRNRRQQQRDLGEGDNDRDSNGRTGRDDDEDDDEDGDESNRRCFPYRRGFVASELKRISGPSRLVIEHCGLTDGHLSALIRLLRVEAEKVKRGSLLVVQPQQPQSGPAAPSSICSSTTTSAPSSTSLLSTHFLASVSSLRLSGQFMPVTLMGLLGAMQDTFDDAKLFWAKANSKSGAMSLLSPDDRAARIPFPLEEVELPASTVHTVRSAIQSRNFCSNVVVRSND